MALLSYVPYKGLEVQGTIVLVWIMKSYKKLRRMRKKYSMNGQEITVTEMKESSGHFTQLLGYQSYKSYIKKKGTSKGEGTKKEL